MSVAGHRLGAASVITGADGRVLLVKHGYGPRNWEVPGGVAEAGGMHHFVFLAHLAEPSAEPRVADITEITDVGWFRPGDLPRPMSDFTARRIDDALSGASAVFRAIEPRVWLR